MDSVEEEGSEARPTPTLEKERMLMNTVRIPTESSASPVSQTGSPGQYETSMLEGYTSSVMEVIKIFLFIFKKKKFCTKIPLLASFGKYSKTYETNHVQDQ